MKKQLLALASVAMIAGAVSFSSCKKDDATAPTITITGGNSMTVSLNGTYVAPTVTAADDVDGDVSTSIIVGGDVVNVNLAGIYTVTYTVSDAAGNTATENLSVTVANDAEAFRGTYNVHDSVPLLAAFNYTLVVSPSATVNNRLEFDYAVGVIGFADYQNNSDIYCTVSGTGVGATVTLPSQTANGIGSPAENHIFSAGAGTSSVIGNSPMKFKIVYDDNNLTQSATAYGCIMVLTHQ